MLLLEVISIIDNFKLGLPFYGSDEGQVGLEKAPLFKVGNDRKSLRTTGVVYMVELLLHFCILNITFHFAHHDSNIPHRNNASHV